MKITSSGPETFGEEGNEIDQSSNERPEDFEPTAQFADFLVNNFHSTEK